METTKRVGTKYEWSADGTILTAAMPGGFAVSVNVAKAESANTKAADTMRRAGWQHTMSDRGAVSADPKTGKVDPAIRAKRVEAWARMVESGGDPATAPAVANPIPGLQAACGLFGIDPAGMDEAAMRAALMKFLPPTA